MYLWKEKFNIEGNETVFPGGPLGKFLSEVRVQSCLWEMCPI